MYLWEPQPPVPVHVYRTSPPRHMARLGDRQSTICQQYVLKYPPNFCFGEINRSQPASDLFVCLQGSRTEGRKERLPSYGEGKSMGSGVPPQFRRYLAAVGFGPFIVPRRRRPRCAKACGDDGDLGYQLTVQRMIQPELQRPTTCPLIDRRAYQRRLTQPSHRQSSRSS